MKRALIAALALSPTLAAPELAAAREDQPDQVVLTLTEAGWVSTATVGAFVRIEAGLTADQSGTVRSTAREALKQVSEAADWRLLDLRRRSDATGLERWTIVANARLPEAEVGGLPARLRSVSRTGLRIELDRLDFNPTTAEREKVVSDLRAAIYERVKAELKRLNETIKRRDYRARTIEFAEIAAHPKPVPSVPEDGQAPPNSGVAQRIEQSARVVLAARAKP